MSHSLASVLIALSCCTSISQATSLTTSSEFKFSYDVGGHRVGRWSSGGFVVVGNNGGASLVIHVFDSEGIDRPTAFTVPGASKVLVEGAALASRDVIALAGSAFDSEGRGSGFVATLKPVIGEPKIVRTYPYVPYLLAVTPDGHIWIEGLELVGGKESHRDVNRNGAVLRRFDISGDKSTASFLPRSSVPVGPTGLVGGALAASADRVGWYTADNQYIEIADGNILRYPGIPGMQGYTPNGLAITSKGRVLVSGHSTQDSPGVARPVFFELDRGTQGWKEVTIPADVPAPIVYGTEGEDLVMMGTTNSHVRFLKLND